MVFLCATEQDAFWCVKYYRNLQAAKRWKAEPEKANFVQYDYYGDWNCFVHNIYEHYDVIMIILFREMTITIIGNCIISAKLS